MRSSAAPPPCAIESPRFWSPAPIYSRAGSAHDQRSPQNHRSRPSPDNSPTHGPRHPAQAILPRPRHCSPTPPSPPNPPPARARVIINSSRQPLNQPPHPTRAATENQESTRAFPNRANPPPRRPRHRKRRLPRRARVFPRGVSRRPLSRARPARRVRPRQSLRLEARRGARPAFSVGAPHGEADAGGRGYPQGLAYARQVGGHRSLGGERQAALGAGGLCPRLLRADGLRGPVQV